MIFKTIYSCGMYDILIDLEPLREKSLNRGFLFFLRGGRGDACVEDRYMTIRSKKTFSSRKLQFPPLPPPLPPPPSPVPPPLTFTPQKAEYRSREPQSHTPRRPCTTSLYTANGVWNRQRGRRRWGNRCRWG